MWRPCEPRCTHVDSYRRNLAKFWKIDARSQITIPERSAITQLTAQVRRETDRSLDRRESDWKCTLKNIYSAVFSFVQNCRHKYHYRGVNAITQMRVHDDPWTASGQVEWAAIYGRLSYWKIAHNSCFFHRVQLENCEARRLRAVFSLITSTRTKSTKF